MANTANPAGSPKITNLHVTSGAPVKRPADPLAASRDQFERVEDPTRKLVNTPKPGSGKS